MQCQWFHDLLIFFDLCPAVDWHWHWIQKNNLESMNYLDELCIDFIFNEANLMLLHYAHLFKVGAFFYLATCFERSLIEEKFYEAFNLYKR
jgi:hypothetical protein